MRKLRVKMHGPFDRYRPDIGCLAYTLQKRHAKLIVAGDSPQGAQAHNHTTKGGSVRITITALLIAVFAASAMAFNLLGNGSFETGLGP